MRVHPSNLLLQQQADVMLAGGREHGVDLRDSRLGLHRGRAGRERRLLGHRLLLQHLLMVLYQVADARSMR